MSLYVSIAIMVIAIILCIKPSASTARIYFLFLVLGWGAFLLTFYMNALIRVAATQTGSSSSTDPFNAGILAYNDLLWDFRLSLGLLLISLAVLIFFPIVNKKAKLGSD